MVKVKILGALIIIVAGFVVTWMLSNQMYGLKAHFHSGKSKKQRILTRKLKIFLRSQKRTTIPVNQICSQTWQEKYIKLHKEILQSKRSPKYIVYDCDGLNYGCGGYGNRIGAISSLLLLSVLTNRAFLINWKSNITIQDYLQPRNIAWSFSDVNMKGLSQRHHMWGKGFHKNLPVNTLRFKGTVNSDFQRWLKNTNVTKFFDRQVEKITSQWYFVSAILKNKFFGEDAQKIFLKPKGYRYAFIGCAYNFLFTRTPRYENILKEARKRLKWKKVPVRIGIHFRAGDFSFKKARRAKPDVFQQLDKFLECALGLETFLKGLSPSLNTTALKWFLATDNVGAKRYAHKKFPDKVISLGIAVEHINTIEPSRAGLEGVLLDNVLLSECDILIMSESTFSNTALGMGFHSSQVSTFGNKCIYFNRR